MLSNALADWSAPKGILSPGHMRTFACTSVSNGPRDGHGALAANYSPPVLPDYVTHYHLPDRSPFQNLSDLDGLKLERVLKALGSLEVRSRSHRVFGLRYMDFRLRTEAKLREAFYARGGRPERTAPHYFVLGSCAWFQALAVDMRSVRVALDDLPDDQTTFTYPDSFTAMGLAPDYNLPYKSRPYHGTVFRKNEIGDVVAEFGPPDDRIEDFGNYHRRTFEKYIEVQLWSDPPIRKPQD